MWKHLPEIIFVWFLLGTCWRAMHKWSKISLGRREQYLHICKKRGTSDVANAPAATAHVSDYNVLSTNDSRKECSRQLKNVLFLSCPGPCNSKDGLAISRSKVYQQGSICGVPIPRYIKQFREFTFINQWIAPRIEQKLKLKLLEYI